MPTYPGRTGVYGLPGAAFLVPGTSLFLDLFPGALAAYSFRKLKSNATIAVRFRRESDSVEKDFGFNPTTGDFDVAGVAAFYTGNNFVSRWYDQTGNGNHLIQTVAGNQAFYVASTTINGLPTAKFRQSPVSQMNISVATKGQSNASHFCVITMDPAASFNGRILSLEGDTSGSGLDSDNKYSWFCIGRNAANNTLVSLFDNTGTGVSQILSLSTPLQASSFLQSSPLISMFVNGSAATTGTPADVPNIGGADGNVIQLTLCGAQGVTAPWEGSVSEQIIYLTDQTANRVAIEANQNSYWKTL